MVTKTPLLLTNPEIGSKDPTMGKNLNQTHWNRKRENFKYTGWGGGWWGGPSILFFFSFFMSVVMHFLVFRVNEFTKVRVFLKALYVSSFFASVKKSFQDKKFRKCFLRLLFCGFYPCQGTNVRRWIAFSLQFLYWTFKTNYF